MDKELIAILDAENNEPDLEDIDYIQGLHQKYSQLRDLEDDFYTSGGM